jgi:hypothetical protein
MHKLIALRDIDESGTILRMYGATKEDIDLLAIVEEELRDLNDKH